MAELQDDVEDQEEKIRSSVKEEKNDILRKCCNKFVQFISPKTAQDLQSITNEQRYSG